MKLISDYEVLVISGAWNKHIFTPDWVGNYLIPEIGLQAEYPLNFNGSLRISSDEIRLFIIENRLNFTAITVNDIVLKKIQEYGFKIADYLPHTPVNSFGINFLFESKINKDLENLFNLNDKDKFIDKEYINEIISISRSFKLENYTLNLSFSKSEDTCKISFNYHFVIKDLVDFKGKIDEYGILNLKKISLDLLHKIYNLELD